MKWRVITDGERFRVQFKRKWSLFWSTEKKYFEGGWEYREFPSQESAEVYIRETEKWVVSRPRKWRPL